MNTNKSDIDTAEHPAPKQFTGHIGIELTPGAFCAVNKAQLGNTDVVLKKMKSNDATIKRIFFNDLKIHRKLMHPNIIPFIDFNWDSHHWESCYIVLEWANQGDLLQFLQRVKNVSTDAFLEQKRIIVRDMINGLLYLHDKKRILHRDLKPENILIQQDNVNTRAKICDFGFAKRLEDGQQFVQAQEAYGTANYVAPEILTNCRYSKESDVYAFALIVYVLEMMKTPFEDYKDNGQLLSAIMNGVRPSISTDKVSSSSIRLITDCWSHDPLHRPLISQVSTAYLRSPNDKTVSSDTADKTDKVDAIKTPSVSNKTSRTTGRDIFFKPTTSSAAPPQPTGGCTIL